MPAEICASSPQGFWPHDPADPANAGLPGAPGTGSLVRVTENREFEVIAEDLNLPTSLEIIGNDAWIVSLAGDVVRIDDVLSDDHWHGRTTGGSGHSHE